MEGEFIDFLRMVIGAEECTEEKESLGNMEKRLIDIDEARAKLFEMALAAHKEDHQGNVRFCLDVVRMLDKLWKEQNEVADFEEGVIRA